MSAFSVRSSLCNSALNSNAGVPEDSPLNTDILERMQNAVFKEERAFFSPSASANRRNAASPGEWERFLSPNQKFFEKENRLLKTLDHESLEPLELLLGQNSLLTEEDRFSDWTLGQALVRAIEKGLFSHAQLILEAGPIWRPLLHQAYRIAQAGNKESALLLLEPFACELKIREAIAEQDRTALQTLLTVTPPQRYPLWAFACHEAIEKLDLDTFLFLQELIPALLPNRYVDSPNLPDRLVQKAWTCALGRKHGPVVQYLSAKYSKSVWQDYSDECWDAYSGKQQEFACFLLQAGLVSNAMYNRILKQSSKDINSAFFSQVLRGQNILYPSTAEDCLIKWVYHQQLEPVQELLELVSV